MTVFVDTSALYAYLDRNDENNRGAVAALQSLLAQDRLVTHNYVTVELVSLVHRRLGPAATRLVLKELLPELTVIWITEDVHRAAIAAFLAATRRRTSLVDWVSFEVMRREGIRTAFAFDRDFSSEGFETAPR